MSLNSVLLTGSTGSLGAHILSQLLSTNHKVIATIRSLSKSSTFLTEKYSNYILSGHLTLIELPDLSKPHIFDNLARSVDSIIHVATPLSPTHFQESIDLTWQIDENILLAASKSQAVKRVIITGSIVSTLSLPTDLFRDITISDKTWNPITNGEGLKSEGTAYMFAKTSAEKKAWEFMDGEKRGFDLMVLLAPSITGKCIQEGFVPRKEALGGMADVYRSIFDVQSAGFMFPFFMDVEDVAKIHVRSLDLEILGNERYLFHAGIIKGAQLASKVREVYPQLKSRVPEEKEDDGKPIVKVKVDISKFEKVYGTEWKGWWESAKGTVEDILFYEQKKLGYDVKDFA